jgi:hypothetical protein
MTPRILKSVNATDKLNMTYYETTRCARKQSAVSRHSEGGGGSSYDEVTPYGLAAI